MNALDYIRIEAPSYLQDDYELAAEYEGMLEHSPITITAPWITPNGEAGFARRKVTSGGTYVQKFNPDGTPASKIQAYRSKETECYECGGVLGDTARETKHFHGQSHYGAGCLGHKVCSEACEQAFVTAEQAKFDEERPAEEEV